MSPSSSPIVIASIARTPIAKFCGSFQSLKASELGSIAIRGALDKLSNHNSIDNDSISEVYMGNVVSAGMGQAPCRQAVLGANLAQSTICTTINKVCASGMKSVMLASQSLAYCHGNNNPKIMIAGGMESMSNIPHYVSNSRTGTTLGHSKLIDGVIHDGLWDVYNDQHMGMCAEKCATDYNISRQDQDEYAIQSYQRAQMALSNNLFTTVVPVSIPQRKKDDIVITQDEEPFSVKTDKIPQLNPAFDRNNGTVTAANASSLNDGACAMVLMTEETAKNIHGIQPLARIVSFGEAEQDPVNFTTTPSLAIPKALQNASMVQSDIDYFEINEAFSVVALANMQLLNLDIDKVNVLGGAVALGHPIGMSGARIIGTLLDVLKHKDASIGCAAICNGGGGASAMIIERME